MGSLTKIIRRATAGALAGLVGTAAMDALWYTRYRRDGGQASALTWEAGGVNGWDDVSAPGQVGKLALEKLTGSPPPQQWAQTTQNLVHWGTGMSWGAMHGLAAGGRRAGLAGPVLGAVAWATSYLALAPLGVYQPMATYDPKTLGKDLSAHLVFGCVTGVVVGMLHPRRPG
ncbi:MAG: hypothetical protein ACK5KO_13325 [Arachnia sp.]